MNQYILFILLLLGTLRAFTFLKTIDQKHPSSPKELWLIIAWLLAVGTVLIGAIIIVDLAIRYLF
jgi:hypothetical protein